METTTLKLAEFVSKLNYNQIPKQAIEKVKSCILDTLGCAFLGSTTESGRIVNEFVKSQKGIKEARLWTTHFVGPAANVVLGNGTMIHGFDFDDYHMTKLHPGTVVIPASLAIGEKEHIDGKKLLTSIVVGYETMIHISRGTNPGASRLKGWHLTGTCGTFAAAAAVGKIWGFDTKTMASALGMAGTQSAGLWAFTADGALSKRFHPGRSSQSGVIAATLARNGYRGPTQILEAEDGGFCRATSYDFDLDKIVEGLGKKFDTEDTVIKPYPACGSLHSSIDAVFKIRKERKMDIGKIKEINVYNSDVVNLQCGFDYTPMGALQAQMSMKYCVARAVLDGTMTIAQFSEEKLSDPAAVNLANRVKFVLDDEINRLYPRQFPSIVEIVMEGGQRYKTRINMPKGSVEVPMSRQEIQDKFRSLARHCIDNQRAEAIIAKVDKLEKVKDVATLTALMQK